jgi:hypothetical protein
MAPRIVIAASSETERPAVVRDGRPGVAAFDSRLRWLRQRDG